MINIIIEAFLVAIANCMDTLIIATTCGMQQSMTKKRSLLLAVIFALVQTIFPIIGIFIGDIAKLLVEDFVHYIAFGLFVIIGLKAFLEAKNYNIKEKIFDISKFSVIVLLAVATSMDAFIIGLGFGMQWDIIEQIITLIFIFCLTFIFAIIGVKIGSKLFFIKPRYALVLAGIIFFVIGVKIFIETLL
ncbi:MAG: manganese efflux pump MntP family protein [Bacteroidales bacterium]|jgi:putative Mn2+ efflux pump MntP|nr:manganese efflux pump MntP family protein [Bacteroidales bacterium]